MSKKQPYIYHLVKRRSWWDGTTYAWCGYTDSAKGYRDKSYIAPGLRGDGIKCPDCLRAKKGGRK